MYKVSANHNNLQSSFEEIQPFLSIQEEYILRSISSVEKAIETVKTLPWSDFFPNEVSENLDQPSVQSPLAGFYNYIKYGEEMTNLTFIEYNNPDIKVSNKALFTLELLATNAQHLIDIGVNENLEKREFIENYLTIQLSKINLLIEKAIQGNLDFEIHESLVIAAWLNSVQMHIINTYTSFIPEEYLIKNSAKYVKIKKISVPLIWTGSVKEYVEAFAPLIFKGKITLKGKSSCDPIVAKLDEFIKVILSEEGPKFYETSSLQQNFKIFNSNGGKWPESKPSEK